MKTSKFHLPKAIFMFALGVAIMMLPLINQMLKTVCGGLFLVFGAVFLKEYFSEISKRKTIERIIAKAEAREQNK